MGLLDGLPGSGTVTWQTSAQLQDAIRGSGVGGLKFKFQSVEIVDPDLVGLELVPQSTVPANLMRAVHLSLRAKVGLTLPALAQSIAGVRVSVDPNAWSVNLGSGVPMPLVAIELSGRFWGPLQVGSEWDEGEVFIEVHPVITELGVPADAEILGLVARAFEKMGRDLTL